MKLRMGDQRLKINQGQRDGMARYRAWMRSLAALGARSMQHALQKRMRLLKHVRFAGRSICRRDEVPAPGIEVASAITHKNQALTD